MSNVWNTLFELVVPLVFGPLATWLAVKLGQLITNNVKNTYLQNALLRLDDAVLTAVKEVEQSMKGAPSGEKKQAAVAALKTYLGPKGYYVVKHALGLDDDSILDLFGAKVEAAVNTEFGKKA